MVEYKVSRSAGIIAAHRAIESSKNESERIFHDPYAERLLPPNFTVVGEADIPKDTALKLFNGIVPGFHEFFIGRTSYIDSYLKSMVDNTLEQLVILGAGYDSRPYRFKDELTGIPVFEVDQPATQEYKKEKLESILGKLPLNVSFVPIDFSIGDLSYELFKHGYRDSIKTLFIWEGVSMYVTPDGVDRTLSFISENKGKGSSIIFDHTYKDVLEGRSERKEAVEWLKIASKSEEPLLFGFKKGEVESFLRKRGFSNIKSITHEYFKNNIFTGINEGKESTPVLSLVQAEVSN